MSSFTFSNVNISSNNSPSNIPSVMIFMLIDCDYGPYEKIIVTSLAEFNLMYGIRYIGGNSKLGTDGNNNYYRTEIPESYRLAIWLLELGYTLELLRVRVPIPMEFDNDIDTVKYREHINVNDTSDSSRESILLTKDADIYSYPEYDKRYLNKSRNLNRVLSGINTSESFNGTYLLPIDSLVVKNPNGSYNIAPFTIATTFPTINVSNVQQVYIYSNPIYKGDAVFDNISIFNGNSQYINPSGTNGGGYTLLQALHEIEKAFAIRSFAIEPLISSYIIDGDTRSDEEILEEVPFIDIHGIKCLSMYSIVTVPIFKSLYYMKDGDNELQTNISTSNLKSKTEILEPDEYDSSFNLDAVPIYVNNCMDSYNRCKLIGDQGIIYIYSRYPSYIGNINVSIAKSNEYLINGNLINDYIITFDLYNYESGDILYNESYSLSYNDGLEDWNYIINSNSRLVTVDIRSLTDLPIGSWKLGNIPNCLRDASITDFNNTLLEYIDSGIKIESSIIIDSGLGDAYNELNSSDLDYYLSNLLKLDPTRSKLLMTTIPISKTSIAFDSIISNCTVFSNINKLMFKGYRYPSYMYSLSSLSKHNSTEYNSSDNRFLINNDSSKSVIDTPLSINTVESNIYGTWINNPVAYILGTSYPLDDAILASLAIGRFMQLLTSITEVNTPILSAMLSTATSYARYYVSSTASLEISSYKVYERKCIVSFALVSSASLSKTISLNLNIDITG